LNLLTLAHLTGDDAYRQRAERTLARYGRRVGSAGRVIPMMLCALSQWYAPSMQVVVCGERSNALVKAFESEIAAHYLPFAVQLPVTSGTGQQKLRAILPFVREMKAEAGGAVYVCRDFICRQPVSSVEDLRKALA
jgi:uncharacterized protein YyaL (SSP411 family)